MLNSKQYFSAFPFFMLLILLCSLRVTSAFQIDSVWVNSDSLKLLRESNGQVLYSGQVNYSLQNDNSDSLYSSLVLIPSSISKHQGYIPAVQRGQIFGLGKATGMQATQFHCWVPKAVGTSFYARIDLDNQWIHPLGNLRQARTRIFYLGSSITERGDYVKASETLMASTLGNSTPTFLSSGGALLPAGEKNAMAVTYKIWNGSWISKAGDTILSKSYGWSGATAQRYALNFQWIGEATQFGTNIMLIESGINDGSHQTFSASDPTKNLDSLAESYRTALTKLVSRVQLLDILPVILSASAVNEGANTYKDLKGYNLVLARLAKVAKEVAANQKAFYVSILPEYIAAQEVDSNLRAPDGIHPTEKGAAFMAQRIVESLNFKEAFRSP